MEKPDADGFVNIKWPSQNVPHGGIFHSRVVNSSADEQFIKVLLQESKFDIELRKKDAYGLRQSREEKTRERDTAPPAYTVRPRTSKRRSLSAIKLSGDLNIDDYKPLKRGEDRERMKADLAHMMQYGDSEEQRPPPKAPKPKPVVKKLPTIKDRWHDLVTQIRERADWLAEMEYLGQADPHRDIIKEQIAERMRALDALGVDDISDTSSNRSGFSTIRSREDTANLQITARSITQTRPETKRSTTSVKSPNQKKQDASARRLAKMEENVGSYNKLSPLKYSPRRRV